MPRPTQVAVANRVFLKTNSSLMTILAGRDTKLAPKQVMTFFRRTPPFRVKFISFLWITINFCGIGGVLQKKKVITAKCVRTLPGQLEQHPLIRPVVLKRPIFQSPKYGKFSYEPITFLSKKSVCVAACCCCRYAAEKKKSAKQASSPRNIVQYVQIYMYYN